MEVSTKRPKATSGRPSSKTLRWIDVDSILRTGVLAFVPKGPRDGSLAIHCQGCGLKSDPSRRAPFELVYSRVHRLWW
jgi:hypothetical protein